MTNPFACNPNINRNGIGPHNPPAFSQLRHFPLAANHDFKTKRGRNTMLRPRFRT